MESHPVSSLYKPTPIEEAYAIYIYDALFGNFPVNKPLYLEKSSTIKILERSDVDVLFLKAIWTVVDPEGMRCLTDIAQFHVMLRLIALAQEGLLEKEINRAFTQQKDQTTPVAVIKKTLWMTADEECPLPRFKGIPMPAKSLLEELSNRLQGTHKNQSTGPAPAPAPLNSTRNTPSSHTSPAPAPVPAPFPQPRTPPAKLKEPPKIIDTKPVPNVINVKQPTGIESAIQQIENLGMNSVSIFEKWRL